MPSIYVFPFPAPTLSTTSPAPQSLWNGLRTRELYLTISLLSSEIQQRERLLQAELANLSVRLPPDGKYDHELLQEFTEHIEYARESKHDVLAEWEHLRAKWERQQSVDPVYLWEATRARCVPVVSEAMGRLMCGEDDGEHDLWTTVAKGEGPETRGGGIDALESSESDSDGKSKAPGVNFSRRDRNRLLPKQTSTQHVEEPVVRGFAYPAWTRTHTADMPTPSEDISEEDRGDYIRRRKPQRTWSSSATGGGLRAGKGVMDRTE